MSRRTFFRYFPGKDALLGEFLADVGQGLADQVETRPDEESAWTALSAVLVGLARSAIACLDAAQEHWRARPGSSFAELLDEALRVVAPVLPTG